MGEGEGGAFVYVQIAFICMCGRRGGAGSFCVLFCCFETKCYLVIIYLHLCQSLGVNIHRMRCSTRSLESDKFHIQDNTTFVYTK